ncbi:hypothetical protein LZ554_006850 [Drepanopeziza brunnea f. sp. 'monogermtubi']|nr:hypothetical protein LZ554_006850 [Drepanopeziza brunnea f. sp. 'monogermtubi']
MQDQFSTSTWYLFAYFSAKQTNSSATLLLRYLAGPQAGLQSTNNGRYRQEFYNSAQLSPADRSPPISSLPIHCVEEPTPVLRILEIRTYPAFTSIA